MTVVDAHHPVWDLSVRDQEWTRGPGMAAVRRSFGLENLSLSARTG